MRDPRPTIMIVMQGGCIVNVLSNQLTTADVKVEILDLDDRPNAQINEAVFAYRLY